jgi:hypothetical protein
VGELWGVARGGALVEVSTPVSIRARPGVAVHRRVRFEVTRRHRIPVTTPVCTLVDLATRLSTDGLEAAVNEADKLGLTDPEAHDRRRDRAGARGGHDPRGDP